MKKIYDFIFLRCYDVMRQTGNFDVVFGAIITMTFILTFPLDLIFMNSNLRHQFNLTESKILYSIIFLSTLGINYYLYIHKRKFAKLLSILNKETKQYRLRWRIILCVSIAALIGLSFA